MTHIATDHRYYAGVPPNYVQALANFRAEHPVQEQRIGRHDWTFYTAGKASGETLLLLHGGGGDAEAMFPYINSFVPHFRVIAPNIPPTIKTVEDAVNGLRALLAHLETDQTHVVGSSFGALLAQSYLRRFPETTLDCILSHAAAPNVQAAERINMQRSIMGAYPGPLLMWLNRRTARREIARAPVPAEPGLRAFWSAYFTELYATRYTRRHLLSRARISYDFHAHTDFKGSDLQGWDGLMLLIESSRDDVIDEGVRGALVGLYARAYVQTLEGYSHLATVLAAGEIARSMTRFLLDEELV